MIYISIIIGCLLGAVIGMEMPVISYTYSSYLAIAIIGNSLLSIALTYLGERLNVDIYLAAVVVFVGRMFTNLAIIRRYYVDKWTQKLNENSKKEQ